MSVTVKNVPPTIFEVVKQLKTVIPLDHHAALDTAIEGASLQALEDVDDLYFRKLHILLYALCEIPVDTSNWAMPLSVNDHTYNWRVYALIVLTGTTLHSAIQRHLVKIVD